VAIIAVSARDYSERFGGPRQVALTLHSAGSGNRMSYFRGGTAQNENGVEEPANELREAARIGVVFIMRHSDWTPGSTARYPIGFELWLLPGAASLCPISDARVLPETHLFLPQATRNDSVVSQGLPHAISPVPPKQWPSSAAVVVLCVKVSIAKTTPTKHAKTAGPDSFSAPTIEIIAEMSLAACV
jgi:hypothetical protein